MKREAADMPYDADLVGQIIHQRELSVDAVARRAGYSRQTVYDYLSGRKTLPSEVIRAAFELTLDPRLIHLITGVIPVEVHILCGVLAAPPPPAPAVGPPEPRDSSRATPEPRSFMPGSSASPVRIPPIEEWLDAAIESTELLAGATKYIAKIVRDKVVDQSDLIAIEKFGDRASHARRHIDLLLAALSRKLEEYTAHARRT